MCDGGGMIGVQCVMRKGVIGVQCLMGEGTIVQCVTGEG